MRAVSGALGRTAQGLLLRRMFDAAVATAQPAACVPPHVPDPSELFGKTLPGEVAQAERDMTMALVAPTRSRPS